MKRDLRARAITLRKSGKTYSEILTEIPVAKSTLSLWLRSVQLSKTIYQAYTEKKRLAGKRGGIARHTERETRQEKINEGARLEIDSISKRELWLMGIMLYWAEGSKEKVWRTGERVQFSNSDPLMVQVFLKWLRLCIHIPPHDIRFELYIHETHKERLQEHLHFWTQVVGIGYNTLERTYFKKNKLSSKRKNVNSSYHGQLRISVKNSTDLNMKIAGWVEGVCVQCPVV